MNTKSSSRFITLLKDLALALVNATAILIIAASLTGIMFLNKLGSLSQNLAASATSAALDSVGLNAAQTLQKIDGMTKALDEFNTTLKERKAASASSLPSTSGSSLTSSGTLSFAENQQLEKLTTQLGEINEALQNLKDKRALFTDRALNKIGATLSDSLIRVRDCTSTENKTSS